VRKQRIPIMIASAFGFIAICIIVIGAWGIFPRAMSKTIAPQERISPAELLAASVDATGLEQLQASSEALDISEDKATRLALSESLPRIGVVQK